MYLTLTLLFLYLINTNCFNFDTKFPIVYMDPSTSTRSKSYFGYSIVLYPGMANNQRKWIKIGAPKANDSTCPGTIEPGMVYECEMMRGCTTISLPKNTDPKFVEVWDKNFVGGVMDISYAFDRMAICAYRRTYHSTKFVDINTGACYGSNLGNGSFELLSLLSIVNRNKDFNRYYRGQAGFSLHFPKEQNEMIIGAPGVSNWAGIVLKVSDELYSELIPSRWISSRRQKREMVLPFQKVITPAADIYKGLQLFGYSVSSGYYFGGNNLFYAASRPRGRLYKGEVEIFQFDGERSERPKLTKTGSQFGEYFGYSLSSGKINGDDYDDLIVGAPFHKSNTYNEGRLYVFLGSKGELQEVTVLTGKETNGQFGTTVMFLGDIDEDGYGDVAVGAPFEHGSSGVVYIYRGNKLGLHDSPCQTIIGDEVAPSVRGFGIGISRPADMDENGYQDLAIGAYLSGNAILLRSKPFVAIHYNFLSIPTTLNKETSSFKLVVSFQYSVYNEDSLDISYTIIVDKLLGMDDVQVNVTLRKDQPHYKVLDVDMKGMANRTSSIMASLRYKLIDQEPTGNITLISGSVLKDGDNLCIRCPILDQYRSNKTFYTIDIPITLNCGDDNVCDSDFHITNVDILELRDHLFVIGSIRYITLKVTLGNSGENAYGARLEVVIPDVLDFRQIPPQCTLQSNVSIIVCSIENPMKPDETKITTLELDMTGLDTTFRGNPLKIDLRTITSSHNKKTLPYTFVLELQRETAVAIYGVSDMQTTYFENCTDGVANFTQIFKIANVGVSPVEKVWIYVNVPHTVVTPSGSRSFLRLYAPNATFMDQPMSCHSDFAYVDETSALQRTPRLRRDGSDRGVRSNHTDSIISSNKTLFLKCDEENVVCSNVICTFGPISNRHVPATLALKMMFDTKAVADLMMSNDSVLITSRGRVVLYSPNCVKLIANRSDVVDVSNLLLKSNMEHFKISFWYIIAGIILGLILLTLLVVGLVKVGFFTRQTKVELDLLRAEAEREDEMITQMIEDNRELSPDGNDAVAMTEMTNASSEDLCEK